MDDGRLQQEVAGATAYEELHVPALFSEWTGRVLDAATVSAGDRVLDVACGTGVLTRAAASRVGAAKRVVGVDPNHGMLTVARRLHYGIDWFLRAAGGDGVEATTPMGRADFPSIRSMVEADLRGWLPVMGVHLEEALITEILAEAERELSDFVGPDGRIQFDSPAHIVSTQKPQ